MPLETSPQIAIAAVRSLPASRSRPTISTLARKKARLSLTRVVAITTCRTTLSHTTGATSKPGCRSSQDLGVSLPRLHFYVTEEPQGIAIRMHIQMRVVLPSAGIRSRSGGQKGRLNDHELSSYHGPVRCGWRGCYWHGDRASARR